MKHISLTFFIEKNVFLFLVCDNCTLTLLESSNDLSNFIETESRDVDLDSIPAPWSRLLSYENITEHLIIRLDDITKSTEKIENYNDLQIDKVNHLKRNHYKIHKTKS